MPDISGEQQKRNHIQRDFDSVGENYYEDREVISVLDLLHAEEEMKLTPWQKKLRFWVACVDDLDNFLAGIVKREYLYLVPGNTYIFIFLTISESYLYNFTYILYGIFKI